ncbi:MAG TPA: MraY family glycosyltransferase [Oligoflexia bacterium]|nr:MraY family glycosyltransferase [Oligoflexia bacterium]HMR23818.1 MraY family glycosyltransferase [Oligoflexia bacterium]
MLPTFIIKDRLIFAFILALISFFTCFALTKVILFLSHKFNVLDLPEKRRVHTQPTPRLGGIAFIGASFLNIAFLFHFKPAFYQVVKDTPSFLAIFIGLTLTFLLGMVDDLNNLKAKHKLFFQIAIACVVFILGFKVRFIALSASYTIDLGYLSLPITIIFLVGLQNAFNFIDGIDGLAGGVAWITLASIAILAFFISLPILGWLSLILIASLSAFLVFNWSPAKIFMGDSGSLSLGFTLACFSQFPGSQQNVPYPIYVVFLFLSLPILDTGIALSRRAIKHLDSFHFQPHTLKQSWSFIKQLFKKIMKPDGDHIHHRLLRHYLSHKKVAITCYKLAFFGSLCACLCTQAPTFIAWLITLSYCFFVFQFLISLEYDAFQSRKHRHALQEAEWQKALQSFDTSDSSDSSDFF